MNKILDNLSIIRRKTEKLLPSGFYIVDLVYRDVDCGVFGDKGYTLIVKSSDGSVRGISWPEMPTKIGINRWIQTRICATCSVQPLYQRR